MKKTLFCLLLSIAIIGLHTAKSHAQTTTLKCIISGSVIDSLTGKGIEYATVALTDSTQKVLNMVAADGAGKFNIEAKQAGDFFVTVTSLGYGHAAQKVAVTPTESRINLGTIQLTNNGIEVKEVTVSTFKPLIKNDVDKLVYSVDADPEAQTSTLLDILRKVPQLSVDAEDNVQLNGQSNYKVLVNGKSSTMYSNNFKEVVRSMPANSIKDIEVITNPSTKYESEGTGGIINIITNRRVAGGYNGRISAYVGSFNSYNAGAYVAAQVGKFSFSANYNFGNYGQPENTSTVERINKLSEENMYSNRVNQNSGDHKQHMASLEGSYEIDSLNLITFNVWGMLYDMNSKGISDNTISNHEWIKQSYFESLTRNSNSFGGVSGSLDYQRLFTKPERTFTLSYKIEYDPENSKYDNDITGWNYPTYRQKSWNDASTNEHTLQVDYFDPITKKHQIETGVKYIMRLNVSNSETSNWDDTAWVVDNSRKNDLDYTQHIIGLYAGYVFKLEKFSFKLGGRLEGTINDGLVKTDREETNTRFDNKLFNIVPYVNLSYQLTPMQTLRLSYTQRLQRPGIWYLNPYVNDVDPLNISFGNPDLKSTISHSFALNYSIFSPKWNLNVNANSTFSDNAITRVTSVGDEGIASSTYANIGKNARYGVNAYYSYRLGTKLNVYASAGANYSILEAKQANLRNDGFSYNGNMGVTVGLWSKASFRINGGAFSSMINLQGSGSNYFYSSFSLVQKFYKEKIELYLTASDPFTKYRENDNTLSDDTFYQYSMYRSQARRFGLSVAYRFGKMETQVKKSRRSINNDDKMSGDGGGTGGGGGQ